MSIQQKRTAKIGLALSRIFKKTVQMHRNNSRPHGTHGTRNNMMNSTAHTGDNSVHTCLAPTLPSPALSGGIPDSQRPALHIRLHHILRLRTTHTTPCEAPQIRKRAWRARRTIEAHACWLHGGARLRGLASSAWAHGEQCAHLCPPAPRSTALRGKDIGMS